MGGVVAVGRGRGPPDDGSCHTRHLRDLDVPETTFTGPDLTTFLGLDALGLTAVGQLLWSAWCFSDRGSFSSRESIG